jgi:hypothetical protein
LWSSDGVTLDLGRVREVSRVVFEPTEAPWTSSPRLEVSDEGLAWRVVPATSSLADATLSLYRDPRAGRAEVRFPSQPARFVRLDPALPARPGTLAAGP